jgi:hypothetical protein
VQLSVYSLEKKIIIPMGYQISREELPFYTSAPNVHKNGTLGAIMKKNAPDVRRFWTSGAS